MRFNLDGTHGEEIFAQKKYLLIKLHGFLRFSDIFVDLSKRLYSNLVSVRVLLKNKIFKLCHTSRSRTFLNTPKTFVSQVTKLLRIHRKLNFQIQVWLFSKLCSTSKQNLDQEN